MVEVCEVVQGEVQNMAGAQTESDNTQAATEIFAKTQITNPLVVSSISCGSLVSSLGSFGQGSLGVDSSSAVVLDLSVSDAVLLGPDDLDPPSVSTQSPLESSVMFGLGTLGAALVVLFGAIVSALVVAARCLQQKKQPALTPDPT